MAVNPLRNAGSHFSPASINQIKPKAIRNTSLGAAMSANALHDSSAFGLGVLRSSTCIYGAHELDAARARTSELWLLSLPSSTTFRALVFDASANVS